MSKYEDERTQHLPIDHKAHLHGIEDSMKGHTSYKEKMGSNPLPLVGISCIVGALGYAIYAGATNKSNTIQAKYLGRRVLFQSVTLAGLGAFALYSAFNEDNETRDAYVSQAVNPEHETKSHNV